MPASVLLCLVVAITDGDTLKARCGEEGSYQQIKVRLAEIDALEKVQPFGQSSKQQLANLCLKQEANIRETARDRFGRTVFQSRVLASLFKQLEPQIGPGYGGSSLQPAPARR